MNTEIAYTLVTSQSNSRSTETMIQKIQNLDELTKKMPPLILVHLAIVVTQVLWATASVISNLSLSTTNPIIFSFLREFIAGLLMTIYIHCRDKRNPTKKAKNQLSLKGLFQAVSTKNNTLLHDYKLLLMTGLCLYFGQFCFIVGLQLSSSITASSWQPFQGVLAVVYEYLMGISKTIAKQKIVGILIGTFGAVFMVVFQGRERQQLVGSSSSANSNSFWSEFGGSILFFINCSGSVFFLIFSSEISRKYSSLVVTCYSYMIASVCMLVTLVVFYVLPSDIFATFVCPECKQYFDFGTSVSVLAVLAYWIVFGSIIGYGLLNWANQYLHPSSVTAYWILQPLSAVIISQLLLSFGVVQDCRGSAHLAAVDPCLYGVGFSNLGAVPIVIGLYIVVGYDYDSKHKGNKH